MFCAGGFGATTVFLFWFCDITTLTACAPTASVLHSLEPYSRTSYDISHASDGSRWPSRPIRSLRYIVTCTRIRPLFSKSVWDDTGPALVTSFRGRFPFRLDPCHRLVSDGVITKHQQWPASLMFATLYADQGWPTLPKSRLLFCPRCHAVLLKPPNQPIKHVDLMPGHRLRRWPSVKTTSGQRVCWATL